MISIDQLLQRIIAVSLFFIIAVVPLIINPTAFDYWYQPKIQSVYALISIIIAAAALRYFFFKRSVSLSSLPIRNFLFVYCCSAAISTIFSIDPRMSLAGDMWRHEGLFTILSYAALVLIFASLVQSRLQAELLLEGLLCSAFLVAVYGIVQFMGFDPTRHFIAELNLAHMIGSTIGNGNFAGKFFVLTGPLFVGYCLYKDEKKNYWLCGIALLIVMSTLILTMSRASWLGFICSGVLFLFFFLRHRRTRKKRFALFTAAAIVGAIFLLGAISLSGTKFQLRTNILSRFSMAFDFQAGSGSATRLYTWQKTLPLIFKRPWIGYGLDTHAKVYKAFNFDYSKRFKDWVVVDRAHNNYIDMTIAQGLLGLGAYCGIMASFLLWLWRAIKAETHSGLQMLFCAIFSAYGGYLINDFFSFSVVSVSPTFWAFMGLVFTLKFNDRPDAPAVCMPQKQA